MLNAIMLNEVFFQATRLNLNAPDIVEDEKEQTITAVFRGNERMALVTVFFDGEIIVSWKAEKPVFVEIQPGRTAALDAATRVQSYLATGE